MEHEYPLEKEVAEVLKADDTLNRLYVNPQANDQRFSVYRLLQKPAFRAVAAFPQELPAGCGLGA